MTTEEMTIEEWKRKNPPIQRKNFTNADYVRAMTDDELAEWYWWMLHYVQGYTDSRVALREWLKEEFHGYLSS